MFFVKRFWGTNLVGSNTSVPFQTAKATRSNLRPRITNASVVAKPLARIDWYSGLRALL
jgi:hypothetical protein